MTTTYQVEAFDQCWEEINALLPAHYDEIAIHKDLIPLAPDWKQYKDAADAGVLHIVTCRIDGHIVGYVVAFVRPHAHYVTTLHAFTDIFWLHPDHRRGGIGIEMLQFYEVTLSYRGVVRAYIGTKTFFDLSKLFKRLGWEHIEMCFAKVMPGRLTE
jgi:GNAT superfamily N-acetyltransferase